MTRLLVFLSPIWLLSLGACAQDGGLSSSKPLPKVEPGAAPVTCREARNVLSQVQAAMERALTVKAGADGAITASDRAVSRGQVLDDLDRLERKFQPYYALKPRVQYCNEAAVKFSGGERLKAIRLIKLGFLEPVAPLVAGPADSVTVGQFSEAVAFFIERWSDMTHLPSSKWSPYLIHEAPNPKPRGGPGGPVPLGVSQPPTS